MARPDLRQNEASDGRRQSHLLYDVEYQVNNRKLTFDELATQHKRAAILGPNGSGKTTTLKRLQQRLTENGAPTLWIDFAARSGLDHIASSFARARGAQALFISSTGYLDETQRSLLKVAINRFVADNPNVAVYLEGFPDDLARIPAGFAHVFLGRSDRNSLAQVAIHAVSDRHIDSAESDALGFTDFAEALSGMLDSQKTTLPLVAAISGPWGAGKSSLAALTARRLRDRPGDASDEPHVVVDFNAWLHADARHLDGAMLAAIGRRLHGGIHAFGAPSRFLRPHERLLRYLAYGFLIAGLAVIALFGPWTSLSGGTVAALAVLIPSLVIVLAHVAGPMAAISAYLGNPRREADAGVVQRTREKWARYVDRRLHPGTRLVVFVEDLDRCRPDQTMRVLECVSQILANDRTAVVLVADMGVLSRQVGGEWQRMLGDAVGGVETLSSGFAFMQKIVQVRFEVPRQAPGTLKGFLARLGNAPSRAKPPSLGRRFLNVIAPWQKAAWSIQRPPKNPYWQWPPKPRLLGLAWLGCMIWIGRALVLAVRRATVPASGRSVFPAPALWKAILAAAAYAYANFVAGNGVLVIASKLDLFQNYPATIPVIWGLASVPYTILSLTIYVIVVSCIVGFAFGMVVRTQLRRQSNSSEPPTIEWMRAKLQVSNKVNRYDDVDDSSVMEEALAYAMAELPAYPRMAKRLVTKLRLEIQCLSKRGMLSPRGLTSRVLGKWVLFMERWPEAYQHILGNPDAIANWERQPKLPEGKDSQSVLSEDLRQFLARAPKLGPHVTSLVHYSPP
jgi:molybdopterin-guanine dinucleotide biosynthesis protein